MHRIDKIDQSILHELQHNSSLSNQELAERVCLSPTPCARRVKILKEKGYFRGQVTLIEPEKIGLSVSVFIQVTLEHQAKSNLMHFEDLINSWPEVMECYLMTGDFDYLIRIVTTDLKAFQTFLDERLTLIEGIDNIRSSISVKEVRYKTQLPLEHLL